MPSTMTGLDREQMTGNGFSTKINPSSEKSRQLTVALKDRITTLAGKHENVVCTLRPAAEVETGHPSTSKTRKLAASLREHIGTLADHHTSMVGTLFEEDALTQTSVAPAVAGDALAALKPEEHLKSAEHLRLALETRVGCLESRLMTDPGLGSTGTDVFERLQGAEARIRDLESGGGVVDLRQRVQHAESQCKYLEGRNKELHTLLHTRNFGQSGTGTTQATALETEVVGEKGGQTTQSEEMAREIKLLREENQGLVKESELRVQEAKQLSAQLAVKDQEIGWMKHHIAKFDDGGIRRQEAETPPQEQTRELDAPELRATLGKAVLADPKAYRAQAAEVEAFRARDVEHQRTLADLEACKVRAVAGDQAVAEFVQLHENARNTAADEMLRSSLIEDLQAQMDLLRAQNDQLQQRKAAELEALKEQLTKEHEHQCVSLRLIAQQQSDAMQARLEAALEQARVAEQQNEVYASELARVQNGHQTRQHEHSTGAGRVQEVETSQRGQGCIRTLKPPVGSLQVPRVPPRTLTRSTAPSPTQSLVPTIPCSAGSLRAVSKPATTVSLRTPDSSSYVRLRPVSPSTLHPLSRQAVTARFEWRQ